MQGDGGAGVALRFGGANARRQVGAALHLAIAGLGQGPHRLGVDIAGDNQHRIIGRVILVIEADRVDAVELLHLVHPADHRDAIGVVLIQRGGKFLAQQRLGTALDALAALFEHDIALGADHVIGQGQAAHAVGLEIHHAGQGIGRHGFKIGGDVGGGEGIEIAAQRRHGGIEFAGRMALGALEHQMLEEVGDA